MDFKIWFERSEISSPELFEKIKQLKSPYSGVHFSKTNFLSFRPQPSHFDPLGIYVFPKDYVLSHGLFNNNMFANYPYVFLIEPNENAKILNLDMNMQTARSLLRDMNIDENLIDDDKIYHKSNAKTPGHLFWGVLEYVRNANNLPRNSSWNSLFKKTKYNTLYDPGLGIVHSNEPNQIVYLEPKTYNVVEILNNESGHNVLYRIAQSLSEYKIFKKRKRTDYMSGLERNEITLRNADSSIYLSNYDENANDVYCTIYGYKEKFEKKFVIKTEVDFQNCVNEIKDFLTKTEKEEPRRQLDFSLLKKLAELYKIKYDKEYPGIIDKKYKNNTEFRIKYRPDSNMLDLEIQKKYSTGSWHKFFYYASKEASDLENDVKELISKLKENIKEDAENEEPGFYKRYDAQEAMKFLLFLEKRVFVKRS